MRTMENSPNNKSLIERAKKGDKDAMARIIENNQKNVFALAFRMTGNREDALDITQETFLRAMNSIGKFRGDSGLGTWLYSIAANLSRDFLRRRSVRKFDNFDDLVIASGGVDALEKLDRRDRKEFVRSALASLPPSMRAAFVLRYDRGLKMKEIAEALGKAEGTIKAQLHTAVGKIRDLLEKEAGDVG